jgi:acyl-CoA carboxylase subunit beta
MTARDLLAALLEAGTYRSWDRAPVDVRPGPGYATELARARAATGLDESVRTGEGLLDGRRVAVAVSEFGFLGGSIGVAAAERLTLAVERATAERLPLIAAPASGGTRMQEGTVAFLQMATITAAVAAHQAAGLPYLVYLRHPTTGGVFASWASVGHLTVAEPGALIGFLGPRVYEALAGAPIPDGVQTAENLLAHGLVDAVVPPGELAGYLTRVLTSIAPPSAPARAPSPTPGSAPVPPCTAASPSGTASRPGTASPPGTSPAPGTELRGTPVGDSRTSAWESVLITRRPDRPGAADLIRAAATDVVRLREGGLILALARIGGRPCVLAAQDRNALPHGAEMLRTAQRGLQLAADLGLPLVTIIDTPGGELSRAAEEEGIAREIARCLLTLITLPPPTVAVLLGQGTGGAALALLPADRVLAAQHAWLSPLAPEGASVIVYKDTAHAPELADHQGIRSADLAAAGIVDHIVAEASADQLLRDLGRLLRTELDSLTASDDLSRLNRRQRKYRHLGPPRSA